MVAVIDLLLIRMAGARRDFVFGTTANLAPGTFWSGLIDDVRIHNRVVRP